MVRADRYTHVERGLNSRLDELQAALLRVKLPHLTAWNARRRRGRRALSPRPVVVPRVSPYSGRRRSVRSITCSSISHPRRDALQAFLTRRGVGTYVHYPMPVHLHPPTPTSAMPRRLPVAEAPRRAVSLPMHPFISDDEVDRS